MVLTQSLRDQSQGSGPKEIGVLVVGGGRNELKLGYKDKGGALTEPKAGAG